MEKERNGIEILDRKVMHLNCWYQQNEELASDQYWSGDVIREIDQIESKNRHAEVSDIEGQIHEHQAIRYGLGTPEERYLYGIGGINRQEGTINFTIYGKRGRPLEGPIDYMFKYDEQDDMFYGVWFFVNEKLKTSRFGGYARLKATKYINDEEIAISDIDNNAWNTDAYCNNADSISYMINNDLSNLLPHEEVDNSTFECAKSYFRRNAKTLKMFYEKGK